MCAISDICSLQSVDYLRKQVTSLPLGLLGLETIVATFIFV